MELTFRKSCEDENRNYILSQLKEYNDSNCVQFAQSRLPGQGRVPLEVVAFDQAELVGGAMCSTKWQWLFVDYLWVCASLRGKGIGRSLMEMAEAEARSRGCQFAKLGTYDFQALDFYERLGYRVVGVYEDLPPGHSEYWLRKEL